MIIYNFVTGKTYGEKVTAELEKICRQNHFKIGAFATAQQMKTNSDMIVCKGQKAFRVPMTINGKDTYFCVFNLSQCVVKAVERQTKSKTVYSNHGYIYPPKGATTEDLQTLNDTLSQMNFKNCSGSSAKIELDMTENTTKRFSYKEYKARKQAQMERLEKASKEFENNYTPFDNAVVYGIGDIENCPF